MAFPISPGVFLQDQRCPPEWRSKGSVLFVGPFGKGPVGVPVSLRTARQAEMVFGVDDGRHVTATALRHFFEQGGRSAKVLRVAVGSPPLPSIAPHEVFPAEDLLDGVLDGVLVDAEADPGPDSLSPEDPNWAEALTEAMLAPSGGAADMLAPISEMAMGRIEMLVAPALSLLKHAQARAVYRKLHGLCVAKDIFLLLDPPDVSPEAQAAWFDGLGLGRSQTAIALAPQVVDWGVPEQPLPPSGAVAGLLDRIASTRGIWAPAVGKRACLRGMKLAAPGTVQNSGGKKVNQLCDFDDGVALPQDGVFSRAGTDAPRLRVLRVLRKTRLTLRAELARLMAETDAHSRRSEARLIAEALMVQLWQDGALKGDTATAAFRVITTNNPDGAFDGCEDKGNGASSGAFELCVGLALQTPGKFHWVTMPVS